jgi:death-on-curing protein
VEYLDIDGLVALHVYLMRDTWREPLYGPSRPELLESALFRPRQAAHYEAADGVRQAAYLFHGLLMNHGFVQGNKRTAYAALEWFLWRNRIIRIEAADDEIVAFCYSAENEKWPVDLIEAWLREHSCPA